MKQVVFSLMIAFLSVSWTYGQSRVSGKVTDVAGQALIGKVHTHFFNEIYLIYSPSGNLVKKMLIYY